MGGFIPLHCILTKKLFNIQLWQWHAISQIMSIAFISAFYGNIKSLPKRNGAAPVPIAR
jgi:hypothetical protein